MARVNKIMPSGNTIINQSPNAPRTERGALGEVITSIGRTGAEISEKIRQAASLHEKTRAQNYLDSTLNEIKARAAQDNNISEDNVRKYDEEVDKAVADASGLMTIPVEREFMHQEFLGKSDIGKTQIRNDFVSKALKLGAEELNIYEDNKKNEWIQARSPKDKHRVELEMDTKINEALDAGYIEPADALKNRDSMRKEWSKAQVEYDIQNAPDMAVKLLEAKKYDGISEEDRVKYLNDAKQAVATIDSTAKLQLKKSQIQNEAKIVDDYVKGNVGLTNTYDIGKMIASQQIRPEFGNALIKAINTPFDKIDLEDDDEAFLSMVNSLLESSGEDDINAVLVDILNGFSSGNLGQRNMQLLIEASKKFASNSEFKNQLSNVINTSIRAGFHHDSEMTEDYISQVNQGKNPVEAAGIAIRNKQVKENPESSRYVIGQIIKSGGRSGKVIGFREDGKPLVEVATNAK